MIRVGKYFDTNIQKLLKFAFLKQECYSDVVFSNFIRMWLFDDILRKPQETAPVDPLVASGSSGGSTASFGGTGSGTTWGNPPANTPATPIIILKTAETSLFDLKPTAVNTTTVTIQGPNIPQIHAEEASSMLVTTTENIVVSPPVRPIEAISLSEIAPDEVTLSEWGATPAADNDSIFSFGKGEQSLSESPTEEVSERESTSEIPVEKKEERMIHPRDFIEKSIADIDMMITDIDTAHESKIHEAEEYGEEKDRIAALEKDAYREAGILDEERSHALHVRTLLSWELSRWMNRSNTEEVVPSTEWLSEELPEGNTDSLFGMIAASSTTDSEEGTLESIQLETGDVQAEAIIAEDTSGSVETTLTELAVQNTVTETMEKQEEAIHPKKTKKKEESVAVS